MAVAEEKNRLLEEQLKAKDDRLAAKDDRIQNLTERIELMKANRVDTNAVNTGDALMLQACNQQLAKADAEIFNLRHPGLLRELFAPKELIKIGGAFWLGRVTAPK